MQEKYKCVLSKKLELCPFCGHKPTLMRNDDGSTNWIECCEIRMDGYLGGGYATAEEVVRLWNTRVLKLND